MHTRLYRSKSDQMVAGVCGGLARYLQLDTTLVRLFFALLALADGAGVLIYIILWIVMPDEERIAANLGDQMRASAGEMAGRALEMGDDVRYAASHPNPQAGLIVGSALIVVGAIFLIDTLNLPGLGWISFDVLWPLLLVGGGLFLLLRNVTGPNDA